jgi:hypothetical protein
MLGVAKGAQEVAREGVRTMPEQPNAGAFREIVEAMNRGDAATMEGYLADDVTWHYIGGTEPIRSKAEMVQSLSPSGGDYTITAGMCTTSSWATTTRSRSSMRPPRALTAPSRIGPPRSCT